MQPYESIRSTVEDGASSPARKQIALIATIGGLAFSAGVATSSYKRFSVGTVLKDAWPGMANNETDSSINCVYKNPHWYLGRSHGHYECFNTTAEAKNASKGHKFVYDIVGDDNDHYTPFYMNCDVYDDDVVYSPDICGSADYSACHSTDGYYYHIPDADCWGGDHVAYNESCYDKEATVKDGGCVNGTGCFDWCGKACDSEWWSWCGWDVVAHAPETCNGTYEPAPPGRRLRTGSGTSCAFHSFCGPCGSDNKYCNDVMKFYNHYNGSSSWNKELNVFMEPDVLKIWCEVWDLPYQNRSAAGHTPVSHD
jgi:hypothetical protein